MTPKKKRQIKTKLWTEKATINIGKEGVTDKTIKEVIKQLEARETIKIKILKTALIEKQTKTIAEMISNKTESELVDVRGHSFLLFKPKNKK